MELDATTKKDLEDFEKSRKAMAALMTKYPSLFSEFKRQALIYNATADRLRETAKAMAKESGTKVYIGPFTGDPKHEETWDINALKELLNADEFEDVVKTEFSLPKESRAKLALLFEKYPQLNELKATRVFKVLTPGPKSLDISELDSMG